MNDYDVLYNIYKPTDVIKKGKVIIFKTMQGDYVIKKTDIDYYYLYQYLFSRDFNYVPNLSKDNRSHYVVMDYEKDIEVDHNEKMKDLCNIVSLLHNKTCYFKEITLDKYDELYHKLLNNILLIEEQYQKYFDSFLEKEIYSPAEYLFLRNYSLFYYSILASKDYLDRWKKRVGNKTRERVCLIHNHLELDHFIKNDKDYLISWERYRVDTPVIDLYHLYQNTYLKVDFLDSFLLYLDKFSWNKEELLLFLCMIHIPFELDFNTQERELCTKIRHLIIYLNKAMEVGSKTAKEV